MLFKIVITNCNVEVKPGYQIELHFYQQRFLNPNCAGKTCACVSTSRLLVNIIVFARLSTLPIPLPRQFQNVIPDFFFDISLLIISTVVYFSFLM